MTMEQSVIEKIHLCLFYRISCIVLSRSSQMYLYCFFLQYYFVAGHPMKSDAKTLINIKFYFCAFVCQHVCWLLYKNIEIKNINVKIECNTSRRFLTLTASKNIDQMSQS